MNTIDDARAEIERNWLKDDGGLFWGERFPWVVSYSGGKDSTLLLLLVLEVAKKYPNARPLYAIFSDTGIELDGIVERVERNFAGLEDWGRKNGVNVKTAVIRPPLKKRFFNVIIGAGYPAPYPPQMRWCVSRLKIEPIRQWDKTTFPDGRYVSLTGERFEESPKRRANMERRLDENGVQTKEKRYCAIRNVSSRALWSFLDAFDVYPWGERKSELLAQYGAANVAEILATPRERRSGCRFCTFGKRAPSQCARENRFCADLRAFLEHNAEMRNLIDRRYIDVWYNTPKHAKSNERILAGDYACGRTTLEGRARVLEMTREMERDTWRVWIDAEDEAYIRAQWEIDAERIRRGELVDARTVLKTEF